MFSLLFAGFCFGSWPLLSRLTGLTGPQGGFLLSLATFSVFIPLFGGDTTGFTWKAVCLGLLCGLLNGVGTVFLQKELAGKQFEVSTIMLVIIMTQLVVTVLGGRLIYGDLWDMRKLFGMGTAALTIWLLTSK